MNPKPTTLLQQLVGDARAADALTPFVYGQLRDLANGFMRDVGGGEVLLQRTALVHEAYLKLLGAADCNWQTRTHFVAVAARAMRQVLADECRKEKRQKRGGGWKRITLSAALDDGEDDSNVDVEALDAALQRLTRLDERAANVVQLRFYGGMTDAEIAEVLGVSERTVRDDWSAARAWLRANLEGAHAEGQS